MELKSTTFAGSGFWLECWDDQNDKETKRKEEGGVDGMMGMRRDPGPTPVERDERRGRLPVHAVAYETFRNLDDGGVG